jgi:hypothetical protein
MPFWAYGLVGYSLKIDFFLLLVFQPQQQHRHHQNYQNCLPNNKRNPRMHGLSNKRWTMLDIIMGYCISKALGNSIPTVLHGGSGDGGAAMVADTTEVDDDDDGEKNKLGSRRHHDNHQQQL